MGKPRSRLIEYAGVTFPEVRGFTTEVHFGRQAKHMQGSEGFDSSRSEVTLSIQEIQSLVLEKAGTGQWRTANKEWIDCGRVVGIFRNRKDDVALPTTFAIIHYSNTGCHMVPANPKGRKQ